MAKIDPTLIIDVLTLGIAAFSKKRKARLVLKKLRDAGTHYDAYQAAREKIDVAADEGKAVSLTVVEVKAVDFVMDESAKMMRRVQRIAKKITN